jgi:hypothetical protein
MQMAAAGAGPVPVGISDGQWIVGLGSSDMETVLDWVVDLGVTGARATIAWPEIQPTNSVSFTWTQIDLFAGHCADRGLDVLFNVGGSPAWARPTIYAAATASAPPDDPATFGTFVAAACARYPTVRLWEIWNEPNHLPFWGGLAAEPDVFVDLVTVAHTALKAANAANVVISGGMSPAADSGGEMAPATFLDACLDEGMAAVCDRIGHHPYSYPARPIHDHSWSAWTQMTETTPSLVSVMASHGVTKQLELTEVGAPTTGPGNQGTVANDYGDGMDPFPDHVDEEVQAEIIDDAVRLVRANPALFSGLWIYTSDDHANSGTDREDYFGLRAYPAGAAKDAAAALTAALADTGG